MIPAISAATTGSGGLDYRWVAVGDGGMLFTCDDTTGTTWTSRTSSFGSTPINGVASNGINLYVAVGDAGKLATSPDGITWTQRTSSFGTSNVNCVAYGNGVWIAGGGAGKIATSTDGTTWTQRTSGTASIFYRAAYGNGVWVLGANSGNMISSTTPTSTWTARTSTITNAIDFLTYAPFASIWAAGHDSGTTGALASSTDATTWTARTSSATLTTGVKFNADSSNSIIVVTTAGNATGAVQVMTTTDGITYTNRTVPTGTGNNTRAVAADNVGRWIMLVDGASGTWDTNYSSNGTTWTQGGNIPSSAGLGTFAQGICHSAGTYSSR